MSLDMLDKLQKGVYRAAESSPAPSLELFAHRRNVRYLSLFYMYCFGRYSSELVELVPLYFNRLQDFSLTVPRCYNNVNTFFSGYGALYLQNAFFNL